MAEFPLNPFEDTPGIDTPVRRPAYPFCYQLEPGNREEHAFVNGIREIVEEEGDQLTGRKLVDGILEIYPPGRLFHPNILKMNEYYRKLRTLSERYHVILPPSDDPKKLNSRRIARCIFDEPELSDKLEPALNLIENHKLFNPLAPDPDIIIRNDNDRACSRNEEDERDLSSADIYSNYRDEKNKYGGGISESWTDAVLKYDGLCEAFTLSPQKKLLCFPAILKGAAARYFASVKDEVLTFDQACSKIEMCFVSDAQQSRGSNYLSSLRFDNSSVIIIT